MAKVSYVKMIKNTFYPGVGVIDQTLPSKNKTWESLTMESADKGVLLKIKSKGQEVEIVIPYQNIECYSLDASEAPKKVVVKSIA